MIQKYRSLPDFVLRQLLCAARGERRARINIIGGTDGSSAVFVARRHSGRRCDCSHDNGELYLRPDLCAAGRALALASTLLLGAAAVAALLIRRVEKWS